MIWNCVAECTRIVGWMASKIFGSFRASLFRQAFADARLVPSNRSMCTTQPPFSVLEPASNAPSASSTGFARMGPSMPSGRLTGSTMYVRCQTTCGRVPTRCRGWVRLCRRGRADPGSGETERRFHAVQDVHPGRRRGSPRPARSTRRGVTRHPYTNVGFAFGSAAEPGHNQAVRRFYDR